MIEWLPVLHLCRSFITNAIPHYTLGFGYVHRLLFSFSVATYLSLLVCN